ncbi:TonB-dependent receptor plug domain-containing protein [Oecophyllibacter saccharovorans]|uniref:TonB-dependent receptor plug domain-containing protein n=1 Tax=Oecophyllibacter saccharovorans TaxID=2558360 RepID=UPI001E310B88|nr:TonB-dependent receptor [Oecophyllibacter saccharovorans]
MVRELIRCGRPRVSCLPYSLVLAGLPLMLLAVPHLGRSADLPSAGKDKGQRPLMKGAPSPPAPSPKTGTADVLTVTAERQPRPVSQVGSAVTVITQPEITATQRRTLVDVLNYVPGLSVMRSGGNGGTASVFVRGLNANEVKARLDGMEINDAGTPSGQFDPGQFMSAGLGRVEVLRGPQSGLYGADAMGGVIDITTQEGQATRPQAWIRAEGGTYATTDQAATLSGQQDRFHYMVALRHSHVGGFDDVPRPWRARAPQAPAGHRRVADNRNDNRTASMRFDYDLTQALSAQFTAHLIDAHYAYVHDQVEPRTGLDGPSDRHDRSDQAQAVLHGRLQLESFDRRLVQKVEGGIVLIDRRDLPAGSRSGRMFNRSLRAKADWQALARLDAGTTLLLGVDHLSERLLRPDRREGRSGSASIVTEAGYGQLTARWNPWLSLAANLRFDASTRYGNHLTWRVAPVVSVPGTGLAFKASGGTGFRGPSLEELSVRTLYVMPNPHLHAERLVGFDGGFEQRLWGGHLVMSADYYANHVRDLIQYAPLPGGGWMGSYFNVSRAETHGAEAVVQAVFSPKLNLQGSYTWTVARDTTTHQPLLRRPHHKFAATLIWQPCAGLTVAPALLYVSNWHDIGRYDPQAVRTAPYLTASLALSYQLTPRLQLFMRGDNLTNRNYASPAGYRQPGRAFYGGVRLGL